MDCRKLGSRFREDTWFLQFFLHWFFSEYIHSSCLDSSARSADIWLSDRSIFLLVGRRPDSLDTHHHSTRSLKQSEDGLIMLAHYCWAMQLAIILYCPLELRALAVEISKEDMPDRHWLSIPHSCFHFGNIPTWWVSCGRRPFKAPSLLPFFSHASSTLAIATLTSLRPPNCFLSGQIRRGPLNSRSGQVKGVWRGA